MRKILNGNQMVLGTCYYPEHWPEHMWKEDLERMLQTGIEVIRIAEFAWSKVEPTEGNLNYISTQIDGLRRLGVIDVQRVDDIIKLEDGSLHKVTHNKYRLTTDEEFKNK